VSTATGDDGFQSIWGGQKNSINQGKQDWAEMVQIELVLERDFGLVEPVGLRSSG